MISIVESVS